jgi:hypothetical protein
LVAKYVLAFPPRRVPPLSKQTLRLVQPSFAKRYLKKAMLGLAMAVAVPVILDV